MTGSSTLLPFQPVTMPSAQLAAVSYLARYAGRTRALARSNCGSGSAGARSTGLDRLVGIQRAHVELYIRRLGDRRLDGRLDHHDEARRPRVLPLRPHRRTHCGRPRRLRTAALARIVHVS